MKERCRFCYKVKKAEFCKNIFNNQQSNPSISKIVQMLTNLTIVENDRYTKLCCVDCFDVLILFYHFRESILQTNQLLTNNKINKTNNNNLNAYNKWPGIVREKNGRFIRIDISLHRESDSADVDPKVDEINQNSNQYNEQSHKNCVCIESNTQVLSFIKEEFDIDESCVKIENDSIDEDLKINVFNQDPNKYKEDSQKTNVCIETDNKDVLTVIKEELDIKETCLKIENDSNDIAEDRADVKNFISIIENEDQDSNKSVDDFAVNVQSYNDEHLEHIGVECQDKGKSSRQKNCKKQPYECYFCDKKLTTKSDLKKHLLTHTDEKPYQCNICDTKLRRKVYLTQHLLTHTNEKLYQCNICDKKFTRKVYLNKHSLIHSDKKPHLCNICDKKFRLSADLKKHLLIHTGEKPHQCNCCDKKFTLKAHLTKHMLTHTGEKPHQCNICVKKFTRKEYLKQHLLTHTGERPHLCNICGKKFRSYRDLKKHLLTHTGEKPHQCNFCDKKFTLKGHLKQHLFTHTGEKPYQCNICDKKFTFNWCLKQHLLTHTSEKPHQL